MGDLEEWNGQARRNDIRFDRILRGEPDNIRRLLRGILTELGPYAAARFLSYLTDGDTDEHRTIKELSLALRDLTPEKAKAYVYEKLQNREEDFKQFHERHYKRDWNDQRLRLDLRQHVAMEERHKQTLALPKPPELPLYLPQSDRPGPFDQPKSHPHPPPWNAQRHKQSEWFGDFPEPKQHLPLSSEGEWRSEADRLNIEALYGEPMRTRAPPVLERAEPEPSHPPRPWSPLQRADPEPYRHQIKHIAPLERPEPERERVRTAAPLAPLERAAPEPILERPTPIYTLERALPDVAPVSDTTSNPLPDALPMAGAPLAAAAALVVPAMMQGEIVHMAQRGGAAPPATPLSKARKERQDKSGSSWKTLGKFRSALESIAGAAYLSQSRSGNNVNTLTSVFGPTGVSRGGQRASMYSAAGPHKIDSEMPERPHPLKLPINALDPAYATLARPEAFSVKPRNAARYVPDSGLDSLSVQDMAEGRKGNLFRTLMAPYLKQDGTSKRVQGPAIVTGLPHAHTGGNLMANAMEAVSSRQQGFLRLLRPGGSGRPTKEFAEVTSRVGDRELGDLMQQEAKGAPPGPQHHETERSTRSLELAQVDKSVNLPPGNINTSVPTAPGVVSNQPIPGHGVNKVGGHVEAAGAEPIVSADKDKPIVQALLPTEPGTVAQGAAVPQYLDPNHPMMLAQNTPTGVVAPPTSVPAAMPQNPAQMQAQGAAASVPSAGGMPVPVGPPVPAGVPVSQAPLAQSTPPKRKGGAAEGGSEEKDPKKRKGESGKEGASCSSRSSKHERALCTLLSKLGKSKTDPLGAIATAVRAAFGAKEDKDWTPPMVAAAHAIVRFSERFPSLDHLPSKGQKEWATFVRLLRQGAQ